MLTFLPVQTYGTMESVKDFVLMGVGALSTIFGGTEKGKAVFDSVEQERKSTKDRKEQEVFINSIKCYS